MKLRTGVILGVGVASVLLGGTLGCDRPGSGESTFLKKLEKRREVNRCKGGRYRSLELRHDGKIVWQKPVKEVSSSPYALQIKTGHRSRQFWPLEAALFNTTNPKYVEIFACLGEPLTLTVNDVREKELYLQYVNRDAFKLVEKIISPRSEQKFRERLRGVVTINVQMTARNAPSNDSDPTTHKSRP